MNTRLVGAAEGEITRAAIGSIAGSNFQISNDRSASQPATENLKFERADWTSFRTVEGLQQKAGVPASKLRRLVLKELADNGLDAGASVNVGRLPRRRLLHRGRRPRHRRHAGRYRPPVQHRPPDGLDQAAAAADTRRARQRPARRRRCGARIGRLARRHHPQPPHRAAPRARRLDDGRQRDAGRLQVGTRIEIGFGPAIPEDEDALHWASIADRMARRHSPTRASRRRGGTTPRNFTNCCRRAATARARAGRALDGCTGGKAGEIVAAAGLNRMACARHQPRAGRQAADGRAEIRPSRSTRSGSEPSVPMFPDCGLRHVERRSDVRHWTACKLRFRSSSRLGRGESARHGARRLRQPHAGHRRHRAARDKRDIDLFGCGLAHTVAEAPKERTSPSG